MGIASSVRQLSENEYLLRFAGTDHVSTNDPLWNQLLSFQFKVPQTRWDLLRIIVQYCPPISNVYVPQNLRDEGCLWGFLLEFLTTWKHLFAPCPHLRRFVCEADQATVRWFNFDRRDPKVGVFLQSTEATPCGHLKWKLTPEKPPADTRLMAAMAMVFPGKIVEYFQSFVNNTKLWPTL